jgi:signal peptidase I
MRRTGSRVPLAVALGVAVAGAVLAVVSILVTAAGTGSDRTMQVRSGSMEPAYAQGSNVTVRSVDASRIRRGEVVVFSARDWGADDVFIQRVIGVGGDHVAISPTGTVSIDGTALTEPYLAKNGGSASGIPVDVTVPAGRLFLLGDHRAAAIDSRANLSEHEGTIARSAVTGVVMAHPSDSSPNRLWTWVGAAITAAGLIAAAIAATVRHRRTAFAAVTGHPAQQYPEHLTRH